LFGAQDALARAADEGAEEARDFSAAHEDFLTTQSERTGKSVL
jgi:hypothetical protein